MTIKIRLRRTYSAVLLAPGLFNGGETMIFDMNLKYIERDKNDGDRFYFYGHEEATKEDKQKLKDFDDVYFERHNEHIITNYKDLIEQKHFVK